MRGIAGEEKPSVPHRLDHEAAHGDDAALEDAALGELPGLARRKAGVQLLPDARVGPAPQVVLGVALEVQALDLRRARAYEREAALVVRIDELCRRGRRFHQDAEPAEGIGARGLVPVARRDRRT